MARAANAVLVGRIHSEETHPVSRILIRLYTPVCAWALRRKWTVIGVAAVLVLATIPAYQKLGSEFMPPLDEGDLLYMPSTLPGISVGQAQQLLQTQDRILMRFPEVESVLGKAGRAETPTDPAPLSMMETVIVLKPESQWRKVETWYSGWAPEWAREIFRRFTPDHITTDELVEEMDQRAQCAGDRQCLDHAHQGARGHADHRHTHAGGHQDLRRRYVKRIEEIGARIEALLPRVPGTRSVFSERTGGGYFLDFKWNRDALARYGISLESAQEVVTSAIGGENVTTTIEGRERYPVNVRYMRDYRSDPAALERVLVPSADGQTETPLAQIAEIRNGPAVLPCCATRTAC